MKEEKGANLCKERELRSGCTLSEQPKPQLLRIMREVKPGGRRCNVLCRQNHLLLKLKIHLFLQQPRPEFSFIQ